MRGILKQKHFTCKQEIPMEKSPQIVCLFSPAALLIRSLNEEDFTKRNLNILEGTCARKPKKDNRSKKMTAWEGKGT